MYQLNPLVVFTLASLVAMVSTSCRVADIQTKHDFDITKYVGTWHEIYVLYRSIYDVNDTWQDYVETYTLLQNNSLSKVGHGRWSRRGDDCLTLLHGTLVPTADGGKLKLITRIHKTDFWILDTDYTEFSVTYGCLVLDAHGRCAHDKTEAKVWSRGPTLSPERLAHVRSVLRDACVNLDDLTATPINVERDCSPSEAIGK